MPSSTEICEEARDRPDPTPESALLILGPLRLRGPDGDVRLGGLRPRRLLATLALRARESVSVDRLVEATYGGSPPRSARQNLHTYLWSLRCLISAADARLAIRARPPGYWLDAEPGVLDWDRFRELADTGEKCMRADPVAAGRLLRGALDLWRGDPVADVAEFLPEASAQIAAMDEARLTVMEQRIEADLGAGMERELIAELAELAAVHPFREQMRAHQMVALYRCGRRAEALSVFHGLRRDLADELGLDPGVRLCSLFEAMLRADPALDCAARPRQREDARLGVRGKPAPQGGLGITLGQRAALEEAQAYQGRAAQLARILGLLAAPDKLPRVVRLHGPAGIGKTAFAYELARTCDARGWPAVILDSRDFRHDAASLSEAVASRCAGLWEPASSRPLLLVLDTFEEMADVERDLWNIILPGIKGPVLVVLSGRYQAAIRATAGYWHGLIDDIELSGLSGTEAERLARLHGVRDAGTCAKVVAFAEGNPLFLTVAAQHARSAGPDVQLSGEVARPLIGLMTREITDPQARELLEAASLVRTFSQEILTEMTGRDASAGFTALCRLSFVRVRPEGARVHDLVRESIAGDLRWRAPVAWQAMRHRAYAYLARRVTSAANAGPFVQELLHLAAASSAGARFYAAVRQPQVHVRAVRPGDLARLLEVCRTGTTRPGYPADERARQLESDFNAAQRQFAVTEDADGQITGFAYTIWLNSASWRAAARTREDFFAGLPEPEMAAIRTTPENAPPVACLISGSTHLPAHDHVDAALRAYLFERAYDRHSVATELTGYHLLTADCLDLAKLSSAGLTRRRTSIRIGDCLADEWLLRFGGTGFTGWIAEMLGGRVDAGPPPGDLGASRTLGLSRSDDA